MGKAFTSADEMFDDAYDGQLAGFPSFDEFRKNPDKYRGHETETLASADRGGAIANRFTRKHVYEIAGHRTSKLEEVERIARDYGIPLRSLDYRACFMPLGGGKADVLVKFMPKKDIMRRQ